MSEERRTEGLWSMFLYEEEDRRDPGIASVGFEAVHEILEDVKHGRRPARPNDALARWQESAFWAGYAKDYYKAVLLNYAIRDAYAGQSLVILPNNATSRALYAIGIAAGRSPLTVRPPTDA